MKVFQSREIWVIPEQAGAHWLPATVSVLSSGQSGGMVSISIKKSMEKNEKNLNPNFLQVMENWQVMTCIKNFQSVFYTQYVISHCLFQAELSGRSCYTSAFSCWRL